MVCRSVCRSVCPSITLVSPAKRLHRSRCPSGCGLWWAQGIMYQIGIHSCQGTLPCTATIFVFVYGCTLAPPGEYNWTVHVLRRYGLMSNYFDHLFQWHTALLSGPPPPETYDDFWESPKRSYLESQTLIRTEIALHCYSIWRLLITRAYIKAQCFLATFPSHKMSYTVATRTVMAYAVCCSTSMVALTYTVSWHSAHPRRTGRAVEVDRSPLTTNPEN